MYFVPVARVVWAAKAAWVATSLLRIVSAEAASHCLNCSIATAAGPR